MCGLIDDAMSFVKDTAGEIVNHPGKSLGTLFGVPGYDPAIGGLFNSKNSLVGPTGDFTGSTWNQMAEANPQDSGVLGNMQSINGIADQIAPAIAGGFALGGLGAAGQGASEAAGASATSTPEDLMTAYTGSGGAGTGGALGSAAGGASGDLSGAGNLSPMGYGGSSGDLSGSLGGVSGGGGAVTPTASLSDPMSGGTLGNGLAPQAATTDAQGSLSSLYGPNSTASGAPMGQAIDSSTGGVNMEGSQLGSTFAQPSSGQMMGSAASGGTPATWGNDGSSPLSGLKDLYSQVSPWVSGAKDIMSGIQSFKNNQAQRSYMDQINQMYAPNSPYAQQMMQTLTRQDAAAGRNSQIGNRSVQLAAALTQDRTRALTSQPYYNATTQAGAGNTNVLNGLFNTFGQAASNPAVRGGINQLGSAAFNGLSSLFSGA